jgi:hypothetical protein
MNALADAATACGRGERVVRAPSLCRRVRPFQFIGDIAELCRKFEQCLPRVDLRSLVREP